MEEQIKRYALRAGLATAMLVVPLFSYLAGQRTAIRNVQGILQEAACEVHNDWNYDGLSNMGTRCLDTYGRGLITASNILGKNSQKTLESSIENEVQEASMAEQLYNSK